MYAVTLVKDFYSSEEYPAVSESTSYTLNVPRESLPKKSSSLRSFSIKDNEDHLSDYITFVLTNTINARLRKGLFDGILLTQEAKNFIDSSSLKDRFPIYLDIAKQYFPEEKLEGFLFKDPEYLNSQPKLIISILEGLNAKENSDRFDEFDHEIFDKNGADPRLINFIVS